MLGVAGFRLLGPARPGLTGCGPRRSPRPGGDAGVAARPPQRPQEVRPSPFAEGRRRGGPGTGGVAGPGSCAAPAGLGAWGDGRGRPRAGPRVVPRSPWPRRSRSGRGGRSLSAEGGAGAPPAGPAARGAPWRMARRSGSCRASGRARTPAPREEAEGGVRPCTPGGPRGAGCGLTGGRRGFRCRRCAARALSRRFQPPSVSVRFGAPPGRLLRPPAPLPRLLFPFSKSLLSLKARHTHPSVGVSALACSELYFRRCVLLVTVLFV